jgi:carboxyl-terminal processing protease
MVILKKERVISMFKKILFVFSVVVLSLTLVGCVDNGPGIIDDCNSDEPTECPVVEPTVCPVVEPTECPVDETECPTCEVCPNLEDVCPSAAELCPSCEFTNGLFLEVMEILESNHYSEPSKELLIQGAIEGMIDVLDDPFTSYFDSSQVESYIAGYGETYVGIGVTVQFLDELVVVQSVVEGGPADTGGIRANDIIIEVDGVSAIGQDFYAVIGSVIGDEGTDVTIGILRNGVEGTLYFTMTRAVIDNPTVVSDSFMEGTELIGYIKVNTFGAETATLFGEALDDLEMQGMDSLIVDLRVNGGGYLTAVLSMLREFLVSDNVPMFSTETYIDGIVNRDDYYGYRFAQKNYDIVTLVNGNSASASEVFASAMQEHGDYKVVGVRTYGKGTMQTDIDLTATLADQIHITIGKWFTSDNNWVHYDGGTDGVTPDIIQELNEYEKAYKVFLLNEEVIMYDTVDDRVANIQLVLTIMGYSVRTDGYFDLDTKDAVSEIQSNNGLVVTGNIDSDTLEFINEALSEYQNDSDNDSQLQAAIDYLTGNE